MATTRRHWLRGIFGGVLLGLGLALATIIYAINPLGAMTPWAAFGLGVLIGVVLIFIPAIRRGRTPPPPPIYPAPGYPPR